jgi:glycosyltransferase involved in cell wall biosynthesis
VRTRVLLILPDLNGGGAERTTLNLQGHLDPARFEVRVALLEERGEYLAQVPRASWTLPPGRHMRRLAAMTPPDSLRRGLAQLPLLVRLLYREQAHVVMSSMPDVSLPVAAAWRLLPGLRRRTRWIARDGNAPGPALGGAIQSPWTLRLVRAGIRRAYSAADAVVVPSAGVARDLTRDYGVPQRLMRVIENPIDLARVEEAALETPPELPSRYVLGVGRLEPQKGFDLLLQAFAALDEPELDLVLLGEGSERARLLALASELGVAERLHLLGFQHNPWMFMRRAAAFCLSSRYEGFPHVVLEALACACPIVATDCPHGPAEIVRPGTGWVVSPEDPQALAEGLRLALKDAEKPAREARARARARENAAAGIAGRYGELFLEGLPAR